MQLHKKIGRPRITTPGELLIKPAHHRFLIECVARFITNPGELCTRLKSKKWGYKCGYDPIEIKPYELRKYLSHVDSKEVAIVRNNYLTDFSETPLAFKVERLKELTKLYKQADGLTKLIRRPIKQTDSTIKYEEQELKLGESDRMDKKLAILRQIHDEMGEDAEKLADAIRNARVPELSMAYSDAFAHEVGSILIEMAAQHLEGQSQDKAIEADFTVEPNTKETEDGQA